MIFTAIADKLKRQSKTDFKGRQFEAWLTIQAVSWHLRSPLIEKRLRRFRKPYCGLLRIRCTK